MSDVFDFDSLSFEEVAAMYGEMDTDDNLGQDLLGAEAGVPSTPGAGFVSPDAAPPMGLDGGGSLQDPGAPMGASLPDDLPPELAMGPESPPEDIGAELSNMLQQRDAQRMEDALAYQAKHRTQR